MSYRQYLNEDGDIDEELVRQEIEPRAHAEWKADIVQEVEQEFDDSDLDPGYTEKDKRDYLDDRIEQLMHEREEDFEQELEESVKDMMTTLEQERAEAEEDAE